MLAVRDDGQVEGSVSGGCIEDDIVDRVRADGMTATRCEVVDATACRRRGAALRAALRRHDPAGAGAADRGVRASARCWPRSRRGGWSRARLELATGAATLAPARATDGLAFDGKTLTTIHGPRYRLLVIGASQLSKYLAQMALGLDYQVIVCDPREEYAADLGRAGRARWCATMPDDTVLAMKLDERCAVVALTHDPKLDDLALMEALKSPAFYVGALGSRANNAKRRERLREFDLTDARDRAAARPDRPLHRQPHAAGDRRVDPGRDHRGEERGAAQRGRQRRGGEGEARPSVACSTA